MQKNACNEAVLFSPLMTDNRKCGRFVMKEVNLSEVKFGFGA